LLYLVRMDVAVPRDLPLEQSHAIKAEEPEYSHAAARGRWAHLWRVSGEYSEYSEYSDYSVSDVADNDETAHPVVGTAALPLHDNQSHPARQASFRRRITTAHSYPKGFNEPKRGISTRSIRGLPWNERRMGHPARCGSAPIDKRSDHCSLPRGSP
jgi:muconolactone D-isomerase